MKKWFSIIFSLILFICLGWGGFWLISEIWIQFKSLDSKLSIGVLTASTTVFVSTLTVVLGRYLERKKEIEVHFRDKKIEIYDEFLKEYFNLFDPDQSKDSEDLAPFLREWQRKMILWGGQDVINQYIQWMRKLKTGLIDTKAIFMQDDFMRAIRKDLGHSNNKLKKGLFIHFILRESDLFLKMAEKNPDMTIDEFIELENRIKSQQDA